MSAPVRASGGIYSRRPGCQCLSPPLFSRIQARISRRPEPERLSYSCTGGTPELQHALVDYLRIARGVRCQADQILITEGIHQAIDLVARMLADAGDMAWVEEPSYWGIRHVLAMNAVQITPVAVDASGLVPPERLMPPPEADFRHAIPSIPSGRGDES